MYWINRNIKPTWSGDKSYDSRDNCQARVNLSSFINFNTLAYHRSGQCKNTVEKEHQYLKQYESLAKVYYEELIGSSDSFTDSVTMNLRIFQRKRIYVLILRT
jgi:hypothetical protein